MIRRNVRRYYSAPVTARERLAAKWKRCKRLRRKRTSRDADGVIAETTTEERSILEPVRASNRPESRPVRGVTCRRSHDDRKNVVVIHPTRSGGRRSGVYLNGLISRATSTFSVRAPTVVVESRAEKHNAII